MSTQKTNHPVIYAVKEQAVLKEDGARTEWFDLNGWTDKVVSFEVTDAATVDINITLEVSPQGFYELNQKTCTTKDYVSVVIVNTHTAEVLVRKDSDDVDDLKHPIRSGRFFIENDEGTTTSTFNVWIEGWS